MKRKKVVQLFFTNNVRFIADIHGRAEKESFHTLEAGLDKIYTDFSAISTNVCWITLYWPFGMLNIKPKIPVYSAALKIVERCCPKHVSFIVIET